MIMRGNGGGAIFLSAADRNRFLLLTQEEGIEKAKRKNRTTNEHE